MDTSDHLSPLHRRHDRKPTPSGLDLLPAAKRKPGRMMSSPAVMEASFGDTSSCASGSPASEPPRHQNSNSSGFSSKTTNSGLGRIKMWDTPFGTGLVVPDTYRIPSRTLTEIFKSLDQRDSPARPGKVQFQTLKQAIDDFHDVFGSFQKKSRRSTLLQEQVAEAKIKLQEQAEKQRKGVGRIEECLVRWEQDKVLECFQVKLPIRERIFFTFDISENSTWASQAVSRIIMVTVFISIVTFVLSTQQAGMEKSWVPFVDVICVLIFTLDYMARLLTVPYARMELLDREFLEDVITGRRPGQKLYSPHFRLIRFLASFMGVVDLISVAPFWIELILARGNIAALAEGDTSAGNLSPHLSEVLRIFRVVRVTRVFKMGKLANADLGQDRNMVLLIFTQVVRQAWPALQLVVILVMMALLVFGTLIWFTESGTIFAKDDPECPVIGLCADGPVHFRRFPDGTFESSPSPFDSIPTSFWWVLVTITTVGYGDFFPVTQWGYLIGSLTILYGAIVFALPVGVIGTTFSQQLSYYQEVQKCRDALEAHEAKMMELESAELSKTPGSSSMKEQEQPPPVLAMELKAALQQVTMTSGIPFNISKRWSEGLLNVTKFENVPKEHPCEALEAWGRPVFATLKEHITQEPLSSKFYSQALSCWYRLLAHVAQVYQENIENVENWDRDKFDRQLREAINVGGSHRTSAIARGSTMVKEGNSRFTVRAKSAIDSSVQESDSRRSVIKTSSSEGSRNRTSSRATIRGDAINAKAKAAAVDSDDVLPESSQSAAVSKNEMEL